ncbi:MAG: hypothetical protein H7841_17930 [Magnetospirillum sp. WYHS-4]
MASAIIFFVIRPLVIVAISQARRPTGAPPHPPAVPPMPLPGRRVLLLAAGLGAASNAALLLPVPPAGHDFHFLAEITDLGVIAFLAVALLVRPALLLGMAKVSALVAGVDPALAPPGPFPLGRWLVGFLVLVGLAVGYL